MKSFFQIQLTLLLFFGISYSANAQFKWPNGAKAAICMTYDDGLDAHLDYAIPQLDSAGFKGTFYCTGNSPSLYRRMNEWRKAVSNGHELGNHTLFHPCLKVKPDGTRSDWVKPEYNLQTYTFPQLLNELKTANTLLKAIDGKEARTFAYTCCDCTIGDGISFTDSIKKLFTSARADGQIPETMKGYDIYRSPSWGVNSNSAEDMIAYVNKARDKGTIAVFMFHSVGGGYLNTTAADHRKLVEYISKNRKDFYVATFQEVMNYIKDHSK